MCLFFRSAVQHKHIDIFLPIHSNPVHISAQNLSVLYFCLYLSLYVCISTWNVTHTPQPSSTWNVTHTPQQSVTHWGTAWSHYCRELTFQSNIVRGVASTITVTLQSNIAGVGNRPEELHTACTYFSQTCRELTLQWCSISTWSVSYNLHFTSVKHGGVSAAMAV
jgi:hypothetical protein